MAYADVVDSLFGGVHAMPEAKYGKPCNFCWHPNIINWWYHKSAIKKSMLNAIHLGSVIFFINFLSIARFSIKKNLVFPFFMT